jgi:hypothetical protein
MDVIEDKITKEVVMPERMTAGKVGVYLQVYNLDVVGLVSSLLTSGGLVNATGAQDGWFRPIIDTAVLLPVNFREVGPSLVLVVGLAQIPLTSYANLSDVYVLASLDEGRWGFKMEVTLNLVLPADGNTTHGNSTDGTGTELTMIGSA